MVAKVSESEHLVAAMKAIDKSKQGLSNAELDELISDNSEWITLWITRQLLSLGFIDYKVDFFGNPAKYTLTDLGKAVLQRLTVQAAPKPASQAAHPPQPGGTSPPPIPPQTKQTQT